MSTLALRRTAVVAMTPIQRKALTMVCERLDLGDPAQYTAPGGNVWLIFDDHRIDLRDAAVLGCFCRIMATMPEVNTREELREAMRTELVWPVEVASDANAWTAVLAAQNAPVWVQAASSVPSNWTPVSA